MTEENHRYSVLIVGVSAIPGGTDAAVARLMEKFSLPEATAKQLVRAIPAVVKKDVPHDEAQTYATALREIGAEARVVRATTATPRQASGAGIVSTKRASTGSPPRATTRTSGSYMSVKPRSSSQSDAPRPPARLNKSDSSEEPAVGGVGKTVMGSADSFGFRMPTTGEAPSRFQRALETSQDADDTIMLDKDALDLPDASQLNDMLAGHDASSLGEEEAELVTSRDHGAVAAAAEEMRLNSAGWSKLPDLPPAAPSARDEPTPPSGFSQDAFSLPASLASGDHQAVEQPSDDPFSLPSANVSAVDDPFSLPSASVPATFGEGRANDPEERESQQADFAQAFTGDFSFAEEETMAVQERTGGQSPVSTADDKHEAEDSFTAFTRPSAFDELMAMDDHSSGLPGISGEESRSEIAASPWGAPPSAKKKSDEPVPPPVSRPAPRGNDEFGVLDLRDMRNESGLDLQLDTGGGPFAEDFEPDTVVGESWDPSTLRPSSELQLSGAGIDVDGASPRHPAQSTTPGGVRAAKLAVGMAPSTEAANRRYASESGASKRVSAPKPQPRPKPRPRQQATPMVGGGFDAKYERNRRGTQRIVRFLLTLTLGVVVVAGLVAGAMLYLQWASARDATRFAQDPYYVEHHIRVGEGTDTVRACSSGPEADDWVCRYSREWYAANFATMSDTALDRAPASCFGRFSDDGMNMREALDCTLATSNGEPRRLVWLADRRCNKSVHTLAAGESTQCQTGALAQIMAQDTELPTIAPDSESVTVEFVRDIEQDTDVGALSTREYRFTFADGRQEYRHFAPSLQTYVRITALAGATTFRVSFSERDGASRGVGVWPR